MSERKPPRLNYDEMMNLAPIAALTLLLAVPMDATQQKPPAPAPPKPPVVTQKPRPPAQSSATTVATVTVTDQAGAPLTDVRVMLTGLLDRSGSTQTSGIVKFDGLRPGVYRLRFSKEGYTTLEREFEWRAGQPAPAPSVTLSTAPPPPAPPPPPAAARPSMPAPGKPVALSLPDFIEKNYITNSQPQKTSPVACSGLAQNVLWQIREPWENRQNDTADTMLYVIGGEGTLRLDGRDSALQAGHFASIPRGSSYSLLRRGRNPLIVLATLVGEPCQP
jgi:Carboxypeptidase regulatory-like domain